MRQSLQRSIDAVNKDLKRIDKAILKLVASDDHWQARRELLESAPGVGPVQRGQRRIQGGRRCLRSTLYMAALSACRCNPVIRAFAARIKAQGKAHHVVLTACMRKLLVILNTILKTHTPWTLRFASADEIPP